jgi:hypothetical protein
MLTVTHLLGPPLGRVHHQVAHRVLDVVVGLDVVGVPASERPLDRGVGGGGIRCLAQVVAEQQGIALVGPPDLAHVQVGGPPARRRPEVALRPVRRVPVLAGRHVVGGDPGGHRAQALERRREAGVVEAGHADLDVDDVLGGQARHRGRADVVDPHRQVAQRPAQQRLQLPVGGRPAVVVGSDDDPRGPLLAHPHLPMQENLVGPAG